MIYYKIGCNFDPYLIDAVIKLNSLNNQAKVNEFYGSDRNYAFLTARPNFRLPNVDRQYIENFVKKCTEAEIEFNYTLNSIYPGSKRLLASRKDEIIDFISFLEDIGVGTITISNPIMAALVREASDKIGLEVSTIAHIDTVTQIKAWKDEFRINKVCGNLLKNRSIKFLKNAVGYCQKNDIILNLMVNEFCCIGGGEQDGSSAYSTHCIYRDSCYLCHAENIYEEDTQLLNSYPMRYCIAFRKDPSSWLKAHFIRPEDINLYLNIHLNHFKITGRTGTTAYILKVTEAYLKNSWDGNLLSLWKPLETILTNEDENRFQHPYFIDNKKLSGFVNHWFDNESHDRAIEVCGETCNYCNEFYQKNFRNATTQGKGSGKRQSRKR